MAIIRVSVIVSVLILGADCNERRLQFGNHITNHQIPDNLFNGREKEYYSPLRRLGRRLVYDDSGSGSFGHGNSNRLPTDPWPGRWFPEKVAPEPEKTGALSEHTYAHGHSQAHAHAHHGTKSESDMTSMINPDCDDGKTNLTVDWSGSAENYTCLLDTFRPDTEAPAYLWQDYLPSDYRPDHECMDKPIYYESNLPTYGVHRPAWAKYGEYKFLPRQRWLHNLEHGGIVMLYHPCAHPLLVRKLKDIVKSCLFRHIITPYTLLTPERPLAILAWGWAMTMSMVNTGTVEKFIISKALRTYENTSKDGDYDLLLQHPAKVVSDVDDTNLCPNKLSMHM